MPYNSAAGIIAGLGASPTIASFTLTDTSGVGSTGFFRQGAAFPKGFVPAGRILQATVGGQQIRLATMQKNTWSDGSLRSCILVGDAGSVSGTVTVRIRHTVGSQAASGLDIWTYITNQPDLFVEVTSHSGSSSGALPNRTYSLKDAILTTSRRWIQEDNPVCVRTFAWGAPSGEKHLMCLHYCDFWLSSGGTVVAVEYTPVLSQHWWIDDPFADGAQTKEARSYAAAIKSGLGTLETRTISGHAYYTQWASLRPDSDDQHAKRHWLNKGSAMPRLLVQISDSWLRRMMKAGYLPPIKQGLSGLTNPNSATYTPLGTNNHRAAINGTGAYEGRGMVTNPDAHLLASQTAANWRVARVSAQASLSVFHHIKDHRTLGANSPFEADGISLGAIPQLINRQPDGSTGGSYSYDGLATPTTAFEGSSAALDDVAPVGGTGSFSSWDRAHHTVYGYLIAFLEGERYLYDAVMDQYHTSHMLGSTTGTGSELNNPNLQWASSPAGSRGQIQGVPIESVTANKWGQCMVAPSEQERSPAWQALSWGHAYALAPDDDRHKPYLLALAKNYDNYLTASVAYFPAGQADIGWWWWRNPPALNGWMNALSALMFSRAALLVEDIYPGWSEFINRQAKGAARAWSACPYWLAYDVQTINSDNTTAVAFYPSNEFWVIHDGDLSATTDRFTWTDSAASNRPKPVDGDKIRFQSNSSLPPAPPAEVSVGTDYYVVNLTVVSSTSVTFQLATTPGGAAINFAAGANDYELSWLSSNLPGLTVVGTGGGGVEDDDSFSMMQAALAEFLNARGQADMTGSVRAAARTFTAPIVPANYLAWIFDGDLMA